jgi:HAMP domain-containing protein
MGFFSDLKFRCKLVVLLTFPVLCLLYFAGVNIQHDWKQAQELDQMHQTILLSVKLSHFLEATQRERGMSGLYVISHGKHFSEQVKNQRIETNQRLNEITRFLKNTPINAPQLHIKLDHMLANAYRLKEVRSSIDHFNVSTSELGTYFSQINEELLDTISIARDLNTNTVTYPLLRAYYHLLQATEDIGQQRRYLTLAFYQNKISQSDFDRVIYWTGGESRHIDVFKKVATPSAQIFYKKLTQVPVYKTRLDMRESFLKKGMQGSYGQDPEIWFNVSTQWLNTLSALENGLSHDLVHNSIQQRNIYLDSYQQSIFLTLLSLLATILVAIYLTRSISKPLLYCIEFSKQVAAGDLTAHLELNRNDEIGQLSHAMNRMVTNLKKMTEDMQANALFVAYASKELNDTVEDMKNVSASEKSDDEHHVDIVNLHHFLMKMIIVSSDSERMTREVKKIILAVEEMTGLIKQANLSRNLILSIKSESETDSEISNEDSSTEGSSANNDKESIRAAADKQFERSTMEAASPNVIERMNYMSPQKKLTEKKFDQAAASDKLSKTATQLSEMADNIEKMIQTFKVK